ncbi:MAG: HNH endonuclease [Bacteroidia bacterium]
MRKAIPKALRQRVAERAHSICEYCLIAEEDTFFGCEVDHIISVKHGGGNDFHNLAYACLACNRAKGSDLASLASTGDLVGFFNPRKQRWQDHFILDGTQIFPLSAVGEVTADIFKFNIIERLVERNTLSRIGRYLPDEAFAYLGEESEDEEF